MCEYTLIELLSAYLFVSGLTSLFVIAALYLLHEDTPPPEDSHYTDDALTNLRKNHFLDDEKPNPSVKRP